MKRLGNKFRLQFVLLAVCLGLMNQSAKGVGEINPILQPFLGGTNFNTVIFIISYLESSLPDDSLFGPLVSMTGENGNVSFYDGLNNPPVSYQNITYCPLQVYFFTNSVAPEVLSEKYTLTFINCAIYDESLGGYVNYPSYSTDVNIVIGQYFLVQPQGISTFVGNSVIFTAQAIHTSGYQWQKDGTNLVENGHFTGVTNASLTISNAQPEDMGNFTVIANHPDNQPISSDTALFGVFKPIQLSLTISPVDDSFQFQVSNQDASPVDENEISHFTIYTTTDLSLDVSNWDVENCPQAFSPTGSIKLLFPTMEV